MTAPMFRFTFVFDGEQVVDREFRALESRISDVSPAWPAVVRAFRAAVALAFATEGASQGQKWAPLTLSTAKDRLRKGFPGFHPILARTHELEQSLTGGGGGYVHTTATSIDIGSNDPVFPFHQSRAPRTRLPRRPPVLLTGADRTELTRPIVNYVTGRDPNAVTRARPSTGGGAA